MTGTGARGLWHSGDVALGPLLSRNSKENTSQGSHGEPRTVMQYSSTVVLFSVSGVEEGYFANFSWSRNLYFPSHLLGIRQQNAVLPALLFCLKMRVLAAMSCFVTYAAADGISLTLVPGTVTCIINASSPGSEGNAFGYEDGCVRLVNDTFHMLVSEEYAAPKWVGMRLAHWTSTATLGDSQWERVGTLVLDGQPMISTENCSDSRDHTAALWSPVATFDEFENTWFLTYVGYNCPGNLEGVIMLARSTIPGLYGIGGPFVSVEMLLSRNASAQPWEGGQGDDSFYPYRAPGSGEVLALYGSSDGGSYWSVGVAASPLGTAEGPWLRQATGNPLPINGQRTENPIVLEVLAPTGSFTNASSLLLAVYDEITQEDEGFGLTWSLDGKGELSSSFYAFDTLPKMYLFILCAVWAPGVTVWVAGGVRAPMGALVTSPGIVSVWFNRNSGPYDTLWVAQFVVGPGSPVVPPNHTLLTLRPCVPQAAMQTFQTGANETLRLSTAPDVCVDLYACDTTAGIMDVWTCHAPGDMCGGAFPSNPPINQRFSVNANGTISYAGATEFCLTAGAATHPWLSVAVVLEPCVASGAPNQTWTVTSGSDASTFSISMTSSSGSACINVG